jgi:hypothetical protein
VAQRYALRDRLRAQDEWSERWPRRLLAWANRHAVPVFGHKRFLLVLNTGFDGPMRWRLWHMSKRELRRAKAAIERGEESAMAYGGDRELLTFGEPAPRRWGAHDEFGMGVVGANVYPSMGSPPESPSPPAESTSPPPAATKPRPLPPRGGWITRRI